MNPEIYNKFKAPSIVTVIDLLATDFFFKFWHTLFLKCE